MLSEQDIIKLDYIYELIDEMERNVNSSYEVLSNAKHEGFIKYQLSLSFLNMAETNYVNYLYIVREIGAERDETYGFEKSYSEYKYELHSYVIKKDDNPSWLGSRKTQFIEKCDVLKEFISQVTRDYMESRRS